MDEKLKQSAETNIICKTPDALIRAAQQLLEQYPENRIFAFYGEMGAGKTTFIKAICKKLGVTDIVSSPTFSIINVYESIDYGSLFHFDFYRLKSPEEIFDIGYEDYLFSGRYCFLEWPEKVEALLPRNIVHVSLAVNEKDNSRTIVF